MDRSDLLHFGGAIVGAAVAIAIGVPLGFSSGALGTTILVGIVGGILSADLLGARHERHQVVQRPRRRMPARTH